MNEQITLARATQNILQQSLLLKETQNLVIFADPESLPAVDAITTTAQDLHVAVTTFYVPRSVQEKFSNDDRLPPTVEAALQDADAILSCLSDRPEHMAYRTRVLRDGWQWRTRFAHVPGMTVEVLKLADTDFAAIRERCSLLAQALALGRAVEIRSRDHNGNEYKLVAQLGGWEYPPGISDGIIAKGSWANLPPGETYTIPFSAEGSVTINGSIPGMVIEPGQEVRIDFAQGRAVAIGPEDSAAVRHLHNTQIAHARELNDPNWSNLAEIGFGVNPAIKHLHGVELIDEKKAGTVHVALGSSELLGGTVESVIHCDLVIEQPTVYIDGRAILRSGEWALDPEDWRLDHRRLTLPEGWWESVIALRRSGNRCGWEEGRLLRYWSSRSNQHNALQVGGDETARRAGRLLRLLQTETAPIGRDAIVARAAEAEIQPDEVPALIWVLHRYSLVRIERGENR